MSSKTLKAEEVRTYFIEIEKHLDKYKNYIIEGLNNRINKLETNQKPIVNINSGVIYIMKTDESIENVYKIGRTKKFKDRLKTHNTSHVDNIEVLFIYETNDINQVENCLKTILKTKQYRKRKEFYEIDLNLLTTDYYYSKLDAVKDNYERCLIHKSSDDYLYERIMELI